MLIKSLANTCNDKNIQFITYAQSGIAVPGQVFSLVSSGGNLEQNLAFLDLKAHHLWQKGSDIKVSRRKMFLFQFQLSLVDMLFGIFSGFHQSCVNVGLDPLDLLDDFVEIVPFFKVHSKYEWHWIKIQDVVYRKINLKI